MKDIIITFRNSRAMRKAIPLMHGSNNERVFSYFLEEGWGGKKIRIFGTRRQHTKVAIAQAIRVIRHRRYKLSFSVQAEEV